MLQKESGLHVTPVEVEENGTRGVTIGADRVAGGIGDLDGALVEFGGK